MRLPEWRVPDLRGLAGGAVAGVRRHWAGLGVMVTAVSLYGLAAFSVAMPGAGLVPGAPVPGSAQALAAAAGVNAAALMTPQAVRPLTPMSALAINAAIPIAQGPNPAASPFALRFASEADRMRSLQCMTEAIYYEAATEPLDGQRAVAQVVLNRVRHPAYPNSVCGVVFQGHERRTGCQFSFTCDGSLGRAPVASLWTQARQIAEQSLAGSVYAPVGYATHYHANYVVPYWASSLIKNATVGAHIFYRWTGGWGRPHAFTDRYAGAEPSIVRRRTAPPPLPGDTPEALADARDAAAAEAAQAAAEQGGSVDSFNRAVLRRYEPLRRETANAMIAERSRETAMPASSRWALTGSDSGPAQTPLGRRNPNGQAAAPAATVATAPAPAAAEPERAASPATTPPSGPSAAATTAR